MKNLILLFLIFFSGQIFAQTSLNGKITDEETGEALLFANIAVYKGKDLITGVQTDFDGFYNLANLDPGTYDVEASYSGYTGHRITGVIVYGGQANNLDFKLGSGISTEQNIKIIKAKTPKLSPKQGSLNSNQLIKLPTRHIAAIAAQGIGCYNSDDRIYMGRGRRGGTFYMPDGFRPSVLSAPKQNTISGSLLGGTPASKN